VSDIQRILDHLRCARSSDECQCLDCLAADEIERLLGIIAARDEWACKAHERIAELEKENDQLRDIEIIHEGGHIRVTIGGAEALPFCIHRNFGDDVELESHPYGHHITDAQIDAAWGSTLQHSDYEVVKRALAELGIERCGGCGGDGRIALDDVDGKYAEGPCPDCHGRGWKIGGGDE